MDNYDFTQSRVYAQIAESLVTHHRTLQEFFDPDKDYASLDTIFPDFNDIKIVSSEEARSTYYVSLKENLAFFKTVMPDNIRYVRGLERSFGVVFLVRNGRLIPRVSAQTLNAASKREILFRLYTELDNRSNPRLQEAALRVLKSYQTYCQTVPKDQPCLMKCVSGASLFSIANKLPQSSSGNSNKLAFIPTYSTLPPFIS
jgi:hypothetical protein